MNEIMVRWRPLQARRNSPAARIAPRRPDRAALRGALTVPSVALLVPSVALLVLLLCPVPVHAAEVRTLLRGNSGDATAGFAQELALVWSHLHEPTDERLVVRAVAGPAERLRRLSRGRGDFAVLDLPSAVALLPDHPRVVAVGVLWPVLLHAVTRSAEPALVELPMRGETWVLDPTGQAESILREAIGQTAQAGRPGTAPEALPQTVPLQLLPDALAYANGPLLIVGAPQGLSELSAAFDADPALRLLPFAPALLEEMRLAQPWLVVETLPAATYARQARAMDLPAVYWVLVGRRKLPEPTVRKMLDALYVYNRGAARRNGLFALLNAKRNAVFAKLLAYHPTSAQVLDLARDVP